MSLFDKKKKRRKIYDLDIDEVTLCKSPANRRRFTIMKQDDREQLESAIEEFLEDSLDTPEDIEKALDEQGIARIIGALDILKELKGNMPDSMERALETLAVAVKELIPEEEEEDDEDDSGNGSGKKKSVKKSGEEEDEFPSFPIPDLKSIQVTKDEDEDDEERDEFDTLEDRLARIERKIDKSGEEEDPFPSITRLGEMTYYTLHPEKLMEKMELEEEEEEIDEEDEIPHKKSLDFDEGLPIKKVEKDDDFDEKFPSISAMFTMTLGGG